jgi:hypothetical protein
MTTATAERQDIRSDIQSAIDGLSDTALDKLASYAKFLRYEERMEELEDAEDIAYINTLPRSEYENAVPESAIIADYEAKYGTLD